MTKNHKVLGDVVKGKMVAGDFFIRHLPATFAHFGVGILTIFKGVWCNGDFDRIESR